ncbi:hypothetical protein RB597_010322 [Gaeumannomyces tritici]
MLYSKMPSKVTEIKKGEDFGKAITKIPPGKKAVLVDCFASWCGPCYAMRPTVDRFSNKFDKIHFVKMDVDDFHKEADERGVTAMPTYLLLEGSEVKDRTIGANPRALQGMLERAVGRIEKEEKSSSNKEAGGAGAASAQPAKKAAAGDAGGNSGTAKE